MKFNLALLEPELAGIQTVLAENLDGIDFVGVNVHGGVNNAVGSDTQDSGEFQPVG
jgi:hypothetical protein